MSDPTGPLSGGDTEPSLVTRLDPIPEVQTALAAYAALPHLLLLESTAVRGPRGRYSFLMAEPCRSSTRDAERAPGDPFLEPRAWWNEIRGATLPDLPPFQGGVAGLLSYELGRCWERIPPARHDPLRLPVMAVHLYPWVLAWDHQANATWLIVHGWPERDPLSRRQLAAARTRRLLERLTSPPTQPTISPTSTASPPTWARPITSDLWSDFSADEYLAALRRVVDYIVAGDIFQANLTQRLLCRATVSPLTLYDRLRQGNPAPFAGLYLHDDFAVISASPERFLQVTGDVVSTRPIKGTRRRSSQIEADLFTRDSLRESEKDQAENVMIVDLLRNDLSRVCLPGTVHVPQLCEVETYATVQHLVSEIRGRLEPGRTPWDLLAATFPGGSITGAPKVRAMEIIAELEPTVRGPYTGSLFYVGHDGASDSNLLIRTFVQRDGWLQCGVGGGIVAQSDPAAEYAETWHKASAMLRAAGVAYGG
jgi:para-aminobenzoate synthetase component 1